jgi:hypothetical protein
VSVRLKGAEYCNKRDKIMGFPQVCLDLLTVNLVVVQSVKAFVVPSGANACVSIARIVGAE